jgi:hypothetical protein
MKATTLSHTSIISTCIAASRLSQAVETEADRGTMAAEAFRIWNFF